MKDNGEIKYQTLEIEIIVAGEIKRHSSTLLSLTTKDEPYSGHYPAKDYSDVLLDTNRKGACAPNEHWYLKHPTRYDALLAANLNPDYPENRHIMWRRNRVYVDCHHATYELSEKFLTSVQGTGRSRKFIYELPLGQERCPILSVQAFMIPGKNASVFILSREKSNLSNSEQKSVKVYLRTDLEDRDFHSDTKAGGGLEAHWASKVKNKKRELQFSPVDDRHLFITSSKGEFIREDEWSYNQFQKNESLRGLESHCDFSPGFFLYDLKPGDSTILLGQVLRSKKESY